MKSKKYFTDHPILELGDKAFNLAPMRLVEVISYDGDKYCKCIVEGIEKEIKAGYIYTQADVNEFKKMRN